MYCPRCGSHNDDDATKCELCDYVFPESLSRSQPQVQPPEDGPALPEDVSPQLSFEPEPEPVQPGTTTNELGFETVAAGAMSYAGAVGRSAPPNALPWAIVVNLCCCNVLGLVSVIFAAQSGAKWHAGDADGAWEAHRQAVIFAWIGFGIGALIGVGYAALIVLGAISGEL